MRTSYYELVLCSPIGCCKLGTCLKENYSDSPSNEYSRHYSAESESEYPRRQNMNSKLGEERKKKGHHVRRSPNFDSNSDTKQKNGQNDNGLMLGRVSINTRTRPSPSNALLLGRVLGLDSAHPYCKFLMQHCK